MLRALSTLCLLAAAPAALAQNPFVLDIDQPQSSFTWSGTTSLGPIVGNPSNAFQLDGTQLVTILPAPGNGYGSVQLAGGDAAVIPDLHGKIPNVFPFLPPLATIDVLNLHLSLSSAAFTPALNSTFLADVTLTALSGTLVVTPLGSAPQSTDLTGLVSSPSSTAGSIGTAGPSGVVTLTLPVNSTFPFSDPTTGTTGSLTVIGTLTARWTPEAPTVYCTPKVNSPGCTPVLSSAGLPRYVGAAPFLIEASLVVSNQPGLLFYGLVAASNPFQGGFLCVAAPVVRTAVQHSGGNPPPNDCSGSYALEFNSHIQGGTDPALVPGAQVFAQYWSRDPGDLFSTGLTAGLRFTIAP